MKENEQGCERARARVCVCVCVCVITHMCMARGGCIGREVRG